MDEKYYWTDVDCEEFERLVAPLVEFLQTKCHPHMSVIVEWDRASLVEDVKSVPRCRLKRGERHGKP